MIRWSFLPVIFSALHAMAQDSISIHQQQLEYYNSLGHTTEWYEQNVNTNVYNVPSTKTGCTPDKVVYGWHPYWVGSAYNNYDWSLLTHFSFFSYEVNPANGEAITTHGWATSTAVDAALANGVKVTLCVTLFGSSDLTTFLTNSTAKQTLIDNLINLVQARGAHGVNIDFEGLPAAQTTNFANFMVDLSNQMHAAIPGSEVSTVLYAVDWSNVFDFSIMEPEVDHYIVMGYAYYYQGSSNTGPCDPLYHFGSTYNYTLSKTTTDYLDKGCPKNKLVMGLPYYGYEWSTSSLTIPSGTTGTGVARTYEYVMNNTSGYYSTTNHVWDTDSYTDIYAFNNGANKQCFITLEDGFRKRLQHVRTSGIAGIGIWALGYDDGYMELWNAIGDFMTECYADSCTGSIHDFGGPTKNYYNNEDYTWTIAPPAATSIDVSFSSFNVEANYDYLYIYDGSSTASPLIGTYTGTNSPGTFSTSSGAVTFRFTSDGATVAPGFNASYACVTSIPPNADFSAPAIAAICSGEQVQFTNSSTNASAYFWEFENGSPATSTDLHPLVSYTNSGSFEVTLHAIEGVDTNTVSQFITINVAQAPQADFASNSPAYWPNSTVFFTNNSAEASSWLWDFGDGNTSSDMNPWNDYGQTGSFIVMLIAGNDFCPADTLYQVVEIIDVAVLPEQQQQIGVYPNPFGQTVFVKVPVAALPCSVMLYDATGKTVFQTISIPDNGLIRLDFTPALSPGIYTLQVVQNDLLYQTKLVKN